MDLPIASDMVLPEGSHRCNRTHHCGRFDDRNRLLCLHCTHDVRQNGFLRDILLLPTLRLWSTVPQRISRFFFDF